MAVGDMHPSHNFCSIGWLSMVPCVRSGRSCMQGPGEGTLQEVSTMLGAAADGAAA